MEERTADEIAAIYKIAGSSVNLINNFSAKAKHETDAQWKDRIKRNVDHLELIKKYKKIDNKTSIWTTEDFTDIDKAITDGKKVYE